MKLRMCLLVLAMMLCQPIFQVARADDQQTEQLITNLEHAYRIKIYYKSVPDLTWPLGYKLADAADGAALTHYVRLLSKELHKYSPGYVARTKLSAIVLVKNLSFRGQARTGIPDRYQHTLILDFKRGNYNPDYQRHSIHHEYYHLIEAAINGSAYWKDPEWASFNRNNFHYGHGGIYAQRGNAYAFTHPATGFANRYSMSALEEDKAEVYAALFVSSERSQLLTFSQRDPVLEHKVTYMIDFIRGLDTTMAQSKLGQVLRADETGRGNS